MKLKMLNAEYCQPDPFIFKDNGEYYIYTTGIDGVYGYVAQSLCGEYKNLGLVTAEQKEFKNYWAPSVIKIGDTYFMYVSADKGDDFEHMYVATSSSPKGPFFMEKMLYDEFSIDSHVVETSKGLFLFYAKDHRNIKMQGTRVYVDRLLDPRTPENQPKELILPCFEEERFRYEPDGKPWYTIEGPFWFKEGEWQYLMYSAGCYQNDSYHVGYAVAKSSEEDLTKVDFVKVTDNGKFKPILIKNEWESGTGHHSVIKENGEYYAIYHGWDGVGSVSSDGLKDDRTSRICRMIVKDGEITLVRHENKL